MDNNLGAMKQVNELLTQMYGISFNMDLHETRYTAHTKTQLLHAYYNHISEKHSILIEFIKDGISQSHEILTEQQCAQIYTFLHDLTREEERTRAQKGISKFGYNTVKAVKAQEIPKNYPYKHDEIDLKDQNMVNYIFAITGKYPR